MKLLKLSAALCAALITASAQAKTLTIGLDVSGSNPLVSDKAFAESAALYAAKQITTLQSGDVVRVMTFGDRASGSNLVRKEYKISKRTRADEIAKKVAQEIATLHKRVQSQSQTNIVGWLELTGGFDCKSGSNILLITDGLEASSQVNPKAFMEGKAKLPKPDVQLQGCDVVFFGLGVGWDVQSVKNVRGGWLDYFKAAGAGFEAETR